MTKIQKIFQISFLIIIIFLTCNFVNAQGDAMDGGQDSQPGQNDASSKDIKFTPQIGLPGSEEFGPGKTFIFNTKSTRPIGLYIQAIYKYAIGVVGILATVVLMVGGIVWLTAGGNPTRIGEAKAYIGASLTGLILALSSYLILATISPTLVNFTSSNIQPVSAPETTKTNLSTTYEKKADGSFNCCNPPNIVPTSQVIDNIYVAPSTYVSGCGDGFFCNNAISPGIIGADPCAGQGYCIPKLGDNSPCSDTINCIDGFRCQGSRCKAANVVNAIGKTCPSDGCPAPLVCVGGQIAGWPGLCFDKSPGSPCCWNSDCLSSNCSIGYTNLCTRAAVESATYRCY